MMNQKGRKQAVIYMDFSALKRGPILESAGQHKLPQILAEDSRRRSTLRKDLVKRGQI